MKTQKYNVIQYGLDAVLSWIKTGVIAIPEIQRPFVWDATKVRDLIDSLYQGYPVGYLIAWRNPNVKLKDGSYSEGKKILIDGQQRVTAITAAILGNSVINKEYRKINIRVAFHPIEERFEVSNPAIDKDVAWIPDISKLFENDFSLFEYVQTYCASNPQTKQNNIFNKIDSVKKIISRPIGLIELESDLDIETVTEIFIRINSKGVPLSQADFAMSKIAVNETYNGPTLRKCIDYFCHLSIAPEYFSHIRESDKEFAQTPYFQKMSWLKNEKDDLYDPNYSDLLRVAFTSEFHRGKLSDLVSLLSGRNFDTRSYEEEIAKQSYEKLERGIVSFINENHFKSFIMIIKSAGFISSDMIRSQNSLNFAYILYLTLKKENVNSALIESYVRKWFVMSALTGRYSGSAESTIDADIRMIAARPFSEIMKNIEDAELSSGFWDFALVQNMDTSSTGSPYFNIFLAAQVKAKDKGLLSRDITVTDMIVHKGDIHHIFPRDFLKRLGYKRSDYNQIANYAYVQSEINIKIGNKAPNMYVQDVIEQCNGGPLKYGGIKNNSELQDNFRMNCIPGTLKDMTEKDYSDFLEQRRLLMSIKIRDYYMSL